MVAEHNGVETQNSKDTQVHTGTKGQPRGAATLSPQNVAGRSQVVLA